MKKLNEMTEKCPYIVGYRSSFNESNIGYLGMEYCPGGELFTLIQNYRVSTGKGLGPRIV